MSLKTELINKHDEHLAMLTQWIREDKDGDKEKMMHMIDSVRASKSYMLQAFAEFAFMGVIAAVLAAVNEHSEEDT